MIERKCRASLSRQVLAQAQRLRRQKKFFNPAGGAQKQAMGSPLANPSPEVAQELQISSNLLNEWRNEHQRSPKRTA